MRYQGRKPKSFVQSFSWIGGLLLAMGILLFAVAIVMQLVPLSPADMNVYINGVRQPATSETVRIFRMSFLLAFGVAGLGLAVGGGVVIGRRKAQRGRNRRLKEEGLCLTAEASGYAPSNVRVNHRMLTRLVCAYTDGSGRTFLFKSGLLRMDPMPYLPQGQVQVYCDRDDMSRYFVDVDGSVGLGDRLVEL